MDKRLIPYSVHLPEHIFLKIKEAAAGRKAASLVREAITNFIEHGDLYNKGYSSGIRDSANKVANHKLANSIEIDGQRVSDVLVKEINKLNT
jgi:hypothetical protein